MVNQKTKKDILLVIFITAVALIWSSCIESRGSEIIAKENPLKNTTWQSEDITGGIGAFAGVYMDRTINFGESNFKINYNTMSNGIDFGSDPVTGTYSISGDTITFSPTNESQFTGTVIGNSLTADGIEYSRIQ